MMRNLKALSGLCTALLCGWTLSTVSAQDLPYPPSDTESPRELSVIGATLAPEEIDRAVLNRLMQEIAHSPDRTAEVLQLSRAKLQDIFISLSNAKNFINDNEIANLRAMCETWEASESTDEQRIEEALDAYKARRQFTLDFIAKFYGQVIADIEILLTEPEKFQFARYLDDRRRRMANTGNVFSSALVESVRSGTESIAFHCRATATTRYATSTGVP